MTHGTAPLDQHPSPVPTGFPVKMATRAPSGPTMGAKEWGMLLTLSMLWGGSFFFFKLLVAELPPFTIVFGRVGIAALILNLLLIAVHDFMPRDVRLWRDFFVMGLLNNVVPFSLIVFGETRISSGLAALLNATTPIFTILIAHLLTSHERLTSAKAVGVVFGFAGVAVLIGTDLSSGFGHGDTVGQAACLLASLTYGFAGFYGRRFKAISPLKVATGQITASTVILLPLALLIDQPWLLPVPSTEAWLALAGLAMLSTALAYILYFRILAVAGPTNLLLVTFLLPGSAMTLGWLFLGETLGGRAMLGMLLIAFGLAAIDGRIGRRICAAYS